MNFEQARDVQVIWKSPAILAAACEIVKAGVHALNRGVPYFGPDDIPESFTASGAGITGSAVHMLREAHIICDYFGNDLLGGVKQGRRKSKRKAANGRKVCLYQLTNTGIAEMFLRRHGVAIEQRQGVLAI